jgi:hypothetical protein
VSSFMVHGESSGLGRGHADWFVGECSAARRGRSSLGFHGDASGTKDAPTFMLHASYMDTRAAAGRTLLPDAQWVPGQHEHTLLRQRVPGPVQRTRQCCRRCEWCKHGRPPPSARPEPQPWPWHRQIPDVDNDCEADAAINSSAFFEDDGEGERGVI